LQPLRKADTLAVGDAAAGTGHAGHGYGRMGLCPKMLLSKAGTKEYFQTHDIDQLIQDIVFEITLNQPRNPKRHIYDFLGRALGIHKDGEKEPKAESKVCSLRMFLEFHSPQSPQIIERCFHRNSSVNEFSEAVLKSWHLDAVSCLSDALTKERTVSTPKNIVKREKGTSRYFVWWDTTYTGKSRWQHKFSNNRNYHVAADEFTNNIHQRCL
jgi:hypothetical protein